MTNELRNREYEESKMMISKKINEPIYVTKPFLPPIKELMPYLESIWDSKILTNNGPLHQELEKNLRARFKWANVSLFSNGHMALEIALKSLGLQEGGEVITTPYTFVSTAAAIVNQGFVPVFCDIGDNFTIDASQIEALVTVKTVAILPVHVYGFPCDVDEIQKIADKHNLKVLYDAAHALGVRHKGKGIAHYGDMSMFSFHATKLYHTFEGGALAYSDAAFRTNIELNKNFGISGPESVELVGMNAKMNEIQAAMGLTLLPHFDGIIAARKNIYERYVHNLQGLAGAAITLPGTDTGYNYAYMPVLFEGKRDAVYDALAKENIFARKYFYPLVSDFECYKRYAGSNAVTNAKKTSQKILTLPIYPQLSLGHVDFICHIIADAMDIMRMQGFVNEALQDIT